MRWWRLAFAVALLSGGAAGAAAPKIPLRVLYIGNPKSERPGHFESFLKQQFTQVMVADRAKFQPDQARDADVVLFDWAQSDSDLTKTPSPLGRLEQWSKPTVLLNSAGLLMAGQWQTIGGAG